MQPESLLARCTDHVFTGRHLQVDPGRVFNFPSSCISSFPTAAAARFEPRLRPRRACPSGRGAPGRRGPTCRTRLRGGPGAGSPTAALSEAGRADGAAMFVARSIAADHKDLIHDVSFDFHGRRMATCSSDQSVKVRAGRSAARGRGRREGRREAARTGADPTETHAIRGHRRRRPGSGESPSHRRIVGSRPPALAVLFLCRACAGGTPGLGALSARARRVSGVEPGGPRV